MKLVSALAALFFCFNTTAQTTNNAGDIFLAANKNKAGITTTPSGLQYLVLTKGNGVKPKLEDKVKVSYELRLLDGSIVDASSNYGGVIEFDVAYLIPGWKEGLQLMPLGSKYQFFIPANLAYGENGGAGGKIKPYETVIVDVELLAINGIAPVGDKPTEAKDKTKATLENVDWVNAKNDNSIKKGDRVKITAVKESDDLYSTREKYIGKTGVADGGTTMYLKIWDCFLSTIKLDNSGTVVSFISVKLIKETTEPTQQKAGAALRTLLLPVVL